MSSSQDKKIKVAKEPKIAKAAKVAKVAKVKKDKKVSKTKITLDSIFEEEDNIEPTIKIGSNICINNSSTINSVKHNIPDDMEQILKEISDAETAMAVDASIASNISMQLNYNLPIKEDIEAMEAIIKKIREKDNLEIIKADEEFARELSNTLQFEQPVAERPVERPVIERHDIEQPDIEQPDIEQNIFNNNYIDDDEIEDILEQIRKFEESEKIKSERKSIIEQQDLDYEATLQADIQRELQKKNSQSLINKYNTKNSENESSSESESESDNNSDSDNKSTDSESENESESENGSENENEKNIEEDNDIDDKPKSKEELRQARLSYFTKT